MASLRDRVRSLPERHGRTTLLLLAAIVALGFGLRAYRVVEPLGSPGDDAHAYYALSKALYEEGSYGGPEFDDAGDWSPGAPLIYAASFYATGGAREGTARIVELLFGLAAIVVVYLLGRRLHSGGAGLLAALGAAVYPPFIHSTGALFSEPPALFTLPAAILLFLMAGDPSADRAGDPPARPGDLPARNKTPPPLLPLGPGETKTDWPSLPRPGAAWRLLVAGLLFGATAMFRPEYLIVGIAFVLLAAVRIYRDQGWQPAALGAALLLFGLILPIAPWTIRNQIVLDRTVPISTGGGKALYTGTFLPADGEYQRVKAILARRYLNLDLAPGSAALDRVDPAPLFDRVADRYPDLPRDQALGRIGKQNFSKFFGEDPVGYAAMTARKAWRMWSSGLGEAMSSGAGRAIQVALVLLGLAGLALSGMRRRWWELIALATPLLLVTAVGAASLAAPRRNEVLMTLVFPLAASALAIAWGAVLSSRPWFSSRTSFRPN
jgi:4-amino-4-deoxy-L-arabinose transferase-like glycosyltransferase